MSVTIVVPTYNRKRFERLLEYNINCQTYRHIVEVLICDDGTDEPFVLDVPYPVRIIKAKGVHLSIGAKRNILAKESKSEFIAHFDDDDIYFPSYIDYSILMLETHKKDVCGTGDMLVLFPSHNWKTCAIHCPHLYMANEATMVYRKSFWETSRFDNRSTGEGQTFLKGYDDKIFRTNIGLVMMCVVHGGNTIDKERWLKQPFDDIPNYYAHKKILKEIGFGNCCTSDNKGNKSLRD
jgi:glycosyltransferase involved in cell wall biosynthesis